MLECALWTSALTGSYCCQLDWIPAIPSPCGGGLKVSVCVCVCVGGGGGAYHHSVEAGALKVSGGGGGGKSHTGPSQDGLKVRSVCDYIDKVVM